MNDSISIRLARLATGEDPSLIARLPSGFLTLASNQFLEGYCIFLAYPRAGKLNDLVGAQRVQFLTDVAACGDALLSVTGAVRINYGIYGNLDPFLHCHLWPRYTDEDDAVRTLPPMSFPESIRTNASTTFQIETHQNLINRIRQAL